MKYNFNNTSLVLTAGNRSQLPRDGKPQIALSGRSNVGKSSLINCLIGRKSLARVSSSPGKTITVNYYEVDRAFYLVDLPGYGFAKRSPEDKARWSALTDGYFTGERDGLLCVAQLVDLKVGCTDNDLMMLDYLRKTHTPYFIIATKADKLNTTERKSALERLAALPLLRGICVITASSSTGEGRERIISEIVSRIPGANG